MQIYIEGHSEPFYLKPQQDHRLEYEYKDGRLYVYETWKPFGKDHMEKRTRFVTDQKHTVFF